MTAPRPSPSSGKFKLNRDEKEPAANYGNNKDHSGHNYSSSGRRLGRVFFEPFACSVDVWENQLLVERALPLNFL